MLMTILGLVGFAASAHLFYKGYGKIQAKKLIESTPKTDIRKLTEGFAEIEGMAEEKEKKIKAPFSGNECIGYKCIVLVQKSQADDEGSEDYWATQKKDTQFTPFYLKDDSGEALVNPVGAEILTSVKYSAESGRKIEPPEQIKKYLDANSIGYKGLLGNKIMKFEEYRISKGDRLYIAGFASKVNDKQAKFTVGKQRFMVISDTDEKSILTQFTKGSIVSFLAGGAIALISMLFFALGLSGFKG